MKSWEQDSRTAISAAINSGSSPCSLPPPTPTLPPRESRIRPFVFEDGRDDGKVHGRSLALDLSFAAVRSARGDDGQKGLATLPLTAVLFPLDILVFDLPLVYVPVPGKARASGFAEFHCRQCFSMFLPRA
jgi:hypothetical protein